MAEALVRAALEATGHADTVRVHSAGLYALHGQPASPLARQVMNRYGLDISSHRGAQLTQEDIDQADVILVMTQLHMRGILPAGYRWRSKGSPVQ